MIYFIVNSLGQDLRPFMICSFQLPFPHVSEEFMSFLTLFLKQQQQFHFRFLPEILKFCRHMKTRLLTNADLTVACTHCFEFAVDLVVGPVVGLEFWKDFGVFSRFSFEFFSQTIRAKKKWNSKILKRFYHIFNPLSPRTMLKMTAKVFEPSTLSWGQGGGNFRKMRANLRKVPLFLTRIV